jgi:uncharacterized protein YkwD
MVLLRKRFTLPFMATTFWVCLALILGSGFLEPVSAAMSPTEVELEVLKLINAERENRGIHALSWNDQLFEAARLHSEDMAENNYFSHTSLDGRNPSDRVTATGYSGISAENIGAGYPDAQAIFEGWMNSRDHREYMLSASYCDAGVGYASATNAQ